MSAEGACVLRRRCRLRGCCRPCAAVPGPRRSCRTTRKHRMWTALALLSWQSRTQSSRVRRCCGSPSGLPSCRLNFARSPAPYKSRTQSRRRRSCWSRGTLMCRQRVQAAPAPQERACRPLHQVRLPHGTAAGGHAGASVLHSRHACCIRGMRPLPFGEPCCPLVGPNPWALVPQPS